MPCLGVPGEASEKAYKSSPPTSRSRSSGRSAGRALQLSLWFRIVLSQNELGFCDRQTSHGPAKISVISWWSPHPPSHPVLPTLPSSMNERAHTVFRVLWERGRRRQKARMDRTMAQFKRERSEAPRRTLKTRRSRGLGKGQNEILD